MLKLWEIIFTQERPPRQKFTCSKSTEETLEKGVQYGQSRQ